MDLGWEDPGSHAFMKHKQTPVDKGPDFGGEQVKNYMQLTRISHAFFLEGATFGQQMRFSQVFSLVATSKFCLTLLGATD